MRDLGFQAYLYAKKQRKQLRSLRDRAMRKFGQDESAPIAPIVPRPLPRILWFFWAQGLENAPPLVQTCASSWLSRNPDWTVRFLRLEDLPNYIDIRDVPHPVKLQHLADIARVRLLREHGGVWADATCYCSRPLDDWLPPLMQSGFFAFDRPTQDRLLASWFLASERQGFIASVWDERIRHYWIKRQKPDRYYWVHFIFEWETICNAEFRRTWQKTPRVSADGPHFALQHLTRDLPPPTDQPCNITAIPVHKLNWRRSFPPDLLHRWGIVPPVPRDPTAAAPGPPNHTSSV